jgi:hypothetical protein
MERDPANTDMQCEQHPGVAWPHDDCIGPGMPLASSPERAPWLREGKILTAGKIGGEHWAEAVKIHAHGMELMREAEDPDGDPEKAQETRGRALRHFRGAESAASIAQASCFAAILALLDSDGGI